MLLALFLTALNIALAIVCNMFIKAGVLSIAPIGTAIIAWSGGNYVAGALALVLAFNMARPTAFRYIWFKLPITILVGFVATKITSVILIVLLYHFLVSFFVLVSGGFNGRYFTYVAINFFANIVVGRLYSIIA